MVACVGICVAGAAGAVALSSAFASPAGAATLPPTLNQALTDTAGAKLPSAGVGPSTAQPQSRGVAGSVVDVAVSVAGVVRTTKKAVDDQTHPGAVAVSNQAESQPGPSDSVPVATTTGSLVTPWPTGWSGSLRTEGEGSSGLVLVRPRPAERLPPPIAPSPHSPPVASTVASSESPSPSHGSNVLEVLPPRGQLLPALVVAKAFAVDDRALRLLRSTRYARPG